MATHSVTQNDDDDDGVLADGGSVSFFGGYAAISGKNPQSQICSVGCSECFAVGTQTARKKCVEQFSGHDEP